MAIFEYGADCDGELLLATGAPSQASADFRVCIGRDAGELALVIALAMYPLAVIVCQVHSPIAVWDYAPAKLAFKWMESAKYYELDLAINRDAFEAIEN